MNIKDIFDNSKKELSSLLPTNLGTKESVYKVEIFKGLSDKEKKSQRRKIRNYVHNIFSAICVEKDEKNLAKLIKGFDEFYKSVYRVNDYSFNSLASENTKGENKQLVINALNVIKKHKAKNK